MPHHIPWDVIVSNHPGSTQDEISQEPDWSDGHQHRIGYKNRQHRIPGVTHSQDSHPSEVKDNTKNGDVDQGSAKKGDDQLINFRDAVFENQNDEDKLDTGDRPLGWRNVIEYTEDWIKHGEAWPINKPKPDPKKGEQDKGDKTAGQQSSEQNKDGQSKGQQNGDTKQDGKTENSGNDEESERSRKAGGQAAHHDAYASGQSSQQNGDSEQDDQQQKLSDKYSPQEIALLRALQGEKQYREGLKENDGKRKSPQNRNRSSVTIDEKDQFTPDNWLPRSEHLIRLTGNHPLNAEAELTALFEGGLITPNELHYVRNHGAVPRITWDAHKLDVENGKLTLSMEDLVRDFESINFAVSLACDGNRRGEMNMVRKSKGFTWGSGATGCAYWRGARLRDVLLAAGVKEGEYRAPDGRPRYVNFEGADEPSEGKYATCIPLEYGMDLCNDVILAYAMNDLPLPPDHGFPLRLMIPGYVGGRCIKWLARVWVSDEENDSHYHIWDNRVLPSFVTEKDGEFARTMFAHPDTACNEQNLNSVIVKPAQGEKMSLQRAGKGNTYRIEGYAYDGGGHEVQRVEVTLDGGKTWLYCVRKLPEYPVRHGNKFWTWVHWYVDVTTAHLLQASSIRVRAWNVFKNTQPEHLDWNIMGMMNNCWYTVKTEIAQDDDDGVASLLFRHPVNPSGDGGWMKPSVENQIASIKQSAGTPQKQFTREEIEKHDNKQDCWLVIDNKVYDATSVLAWHPGGASAILGQAGKVHQETTTQFSSVHDGYAYQKLNECALGVVTDKTANFIKQEAEAAAKDMAKSQGKNDHIALQKHRWTPVKLEKRKELSEDTRQYVFRLPDGMPDLGLGTCQHVQIGFHMQDQMLIRSYTPTNPLLPDPKSNGQTDTPNREVEHMQDGQGTFELVVKTYFPSSQSPGGAMSNILDCLREGDEVEIRGPTGEITYEGGGKFDIEDKKREFKNISLVLGGSGITPGYALLARVVASQDAAVQLRVVDANSSEKNILLRDELNHLEEESKGKLKITHVLSHPGDDWKGLKGHVSADILKDALFPPAKDSVVFLCGPPPMIQKAALPALRDWGYVEDDNMYGF